MTEPLNDDEDLRSAVSESFDKALAADAAPPAEVEAAPAEAAPVEEPAADPETPPEPKPDADGRVRGPDGKFASVKPAEGVKATAAPIGTLAPVAEQQPWQKPLQSLKPEAREKWASVPPEVQQEIHRRERETAMAIQRASESTRQAEPILRAIAPFAQQLAARGQVPEQVIGNFLRTEQALSHPDERQRASVLLQAMRTYGVSVEALASAIEGGQAPATQQQIDPQALVQQAVQGVLGHLGQQSQQTANQQAATALEAFSASGKGEFLEDLKPTMAAMIKAGLATDLQSAYDAACWADPRIRGIIQQREASKKAANATASTQRARAASTSVKSDPGGLQNGKAPPGDSWEEHLLAQMKD